MDFPCNYGLRLRFPNTQHKEISGFPSIGSAALAEALRDFFLASTGEEMAHALALLPGFTNAPEEFEDGLEYEFNRLFIGPQPPLAPPYASVYLEREPRLMGEATLEIGRFYEALGFGVSIAGLPADFLALELEAWLLLETLAKENPHEDIERARQYLWNHLHDWLPLFTGRMRECALSPAMKKIADLLDEWLQRAKEDT